MATEASVGEAGAGVALGRRRRAWGIADWRSWGNRSGPLLAGAVVMGLGVALRAGTFAYHGAAVQSTFNTFAYRHLGGYSDIASLFFRSGIWHHWLPYVRFPFEYPVGTGLVAWLTGLPVSTVGGYLALNAVLLCLCGLLTLWLLRRLPGANPWLLALSPALALYVVLNWDLVAIAALAASLVLFERRRDGWGAVALAVATWTKFFPLVVLPVVLWARILDAGDRREGLRAAARILIPFLAVTVVVNAPLALTGGAHGGLAVRSGWLYFFRFNDTRGVGGSLWALISSGHIKSPAANADSAVATIGGLVVILAAMLWRKARADGGGWGRGALGATGAELLVPATLAALGWLFFAIKAYSPQYDLWVMALLAAAAAPLALAVAFAAADLGYFASAFTHLRMAPHDHWFLTNVLRPAEGIREAVLVLVVLWALWVIAGRAGPHGRTGLSSAS